MAKTRPWPFFSLLRNRVRPEAHVPPAPRLQPPRVLPALRHRDLQVPIKLRLLHSHLPQHPGGLHLHQEGRLHEAQVRKWWTLNFLLHQVHCICDKASALLCFKLSVAMLESSIPSCAILNLSKKLLLTVKKEKPFCQSFADTSPILANTKLANLDLVLKSTMWCSTWYLRSGCSVILRF